MELILFRIDTKALGNKIYLNAIDVLNETRDGWHQLLHDVPVNIRLQALPTRNNLIKAVG